MTEPKTRCAWVTPEPYYVRYHDEEWGIPVHDDQHFFEMLILEGAQAGLSWKTVLQRRAAYRDAFHQFDVPTVASLTDEALMQHLQNPDLIRNRLKIFSVRQNARAFLKVQEEHGSFDAYVWRFVEGKPLIRQAQSLQDIPATTPQSDALSKDLKKRGMTFVGSTIIYAFMQATGLANDHTTDCWRCGPLV